ncbi:hypothetical protein STEG23_009723 [Scotinomys teguina]
MPRPGSRGAYRGRGDRGGRSRGEEAAVTPRRRAQPHRPPRQPCRLPPPPPPPAPRRGRLRLLRRGARRPRRLPALPLPRRRLSASPPPLFSAMFSSLNPPDRPRRPPLAPPPPPQPQPQPQREGRRERASWEIRNNASPRSPLSSRAVTIDRSEEATKVYLSEQRVLTGVWALPGAGARDPATELSALSARDFPRVHLPGCRTHTSNTGYFNCKYTKLGSALDKNIQGQTANRISSPDHLLEPFNVVTDSQYAERVVLHVETAEFIPDDSELTVLFIQL